MKDNIRNKAKETEKTSVTPENVTEPTLPPLGPKKTNQAPSFASLGQPPQRISMDEIEDIEPSPASKLSKTEVNFKNYYVIRSTKVK